MYCISYGFLDFVQSTSLEMTGYYRIFVFFVKSMISGM